MLNRIKQILFGICIVFCVLLLKADKTAMAGKIDLENAESGMTAVLYDSSNGLATSEANTVIQTPDGFIWVGSYAGLYRYDGREFRRITGDNRVTSVVAIFMDSKGRLWVGTNDNGVAIYKDGEFTFYDKSNGLRSDTIRAINEDDAGNIIIGTTEGIAYIDSEDKLNILDNPQINVEYVMELRKQGDTIYSCTSSGKFFTIKNLKVNAFYSDSDFDFTAYSVFPDDEKPGYVYIGTEESEVIYADMSNGVKTEKKIDVSPLTEINNMNKVDGNIWVCANNGIGYIDSAGKFNLLKDVPLDNSVRGMFGDYEGNLWFASSRQGILKIVSNKFSDISRISKMPSCVVNSTCLRDGILYVGTDTGLIKLDKSYNMISDEETAYFDGIRIRAIKIDSKNNLWFSTFSDKGFVCFTPDGNIKEYKVEDGLGSNRVRTCTELSDGSIAVSSTGAVCIMKNGRIVKKYDDSNGLKNDEILTVCEGSDGKLYFGTDGDGMYVIDSMSNIVYMGKDDGLSSEVVLRIKRDDALGVIWIITSNSIAYMKDGKITTVTNFPYSNNFDVFTDSQKNVWVLSSNGVYVVSSEEMLANTENMSYIIYDKNNGLPCVSTANSRSYIREDGQLYISGSTGVCSINIDSALLNEEPVKVSISSVTVDGKEYFLDDNNTITIPSTAKRMTINAYALSYALRDPLVHYKLDGFDDSEFRSTMSKLEKITYTNLDGGEYTFEFSVIDGLQGEKGNSIKINIIKKKAFYELVWFRVLAVVLVILIILSIVTLIFRRRTQALKKKAEEEKELTNQVIGAFAKCIDMKDKYTRGHSFRVAAYTKMIAEKLGRFSEDEIEDFYNIALLHDIGKISIPDNILNKPGRLDDDEFVIMKSHAWNGYEILKEIKIMPDLALGAGYHHERFNGFGYPNKLEGEKNIPYVAQIIAVADSFDAMFTARVYKKKMPLDAVVAELEKCKNSHYNPEIVDAFLEIIKTGIFDEEEKEEELIEKEIQEEAREDAKKAEQNDVRKG